MIYWVYILYYHFREYVEGLGCLLKTRGWSCPAVHQLGVLFLINVVIWAIDIVDEELMSHWHPFCYKQVFINSHSSMKLYEALWSSLKLYENIWHALARKLSLRASKCAHKWTNPPIWILCSVLCEHFIFYCFNQTDVMDCLNWKISEICAQLMWVTEHFIQKWRLRLRSNCCNQQHTDLMKCCSALRIR